MALVTGVKSDSTALVVMTVLMIMLIGSIKMGLISMIPNLAPVIFTLGVMGWTEIPLDMFTLMIGTIVMGLAVDDTIHFMHNFWREYDARGNVDAAVAHTLRGTGQAMLYFDVSRRPLNGEQLCLAQLPFGSSSPLACSWAS